jgi:hypothetical protein
VTALASCAATVLAGGPAAAEPADKADCATTYERSQELRAAGKMREAGETLVRCADPTCPRFIQNDCTQWLVEVQRDMPTVVFAVKDERGSESTRVKVSLDGEVIATELDGRAIAVNPGMHTFRFEIEGASSIERSYVIRQGQKARFLEVSFAPSGGDLPEESPYRAAPQPEPVREEAPKVEQNPNEWLRPYSYAAAGVGVLGFVGFVALGASGKASEQKLRETCVDRCDPDDVDSIRTRYVLADISLGVGIVGLGTGVALYLLSQPRSDTTMGSSGRRTVLDVRPGPGSTFVTVSGAF